MRSGFDSRRVHKVFWDDLINFIKIKQNTTEKNKMENKIKTLKGIEKAVLVIGLAGTIGLASAGLIKKSGPLMQLGVITGLCAMGVESYIGIKQTKYKKYTEENQGQINYH
jgi:undecaprenyl pyrophosphate phosphatase UppP